jgi:hypothetical protein
MPCFESCSVKHGFEYDHRQKFYKDDACGVWNSSPPNYKVLHEFCSFLWMSLNVLVSFFHCDSVYEFKKLTNIQK